MVSHTNPTTQQRLPLSKDRVLQAAIALADAQGIEALTMRNLARGARRRGDVALLPRRQQGDSSRRRGRRHRAGDRSGSSADFESSQRAHRTGNGRLRSRILTARTVMLRHPWAPAVIETRTTMTPNLLRYMDSLLGILIEGGFSNDQGHHAMHALGQPGPWVQPGAVRAGRPRTD